MPLSANTDSIWRRGVSFHGYAVCGIAYSACLSFSFNSNGALSVELFLLRWNQQSSIVFTMASHKNTKIAAQSWRSKRVYWPSTGWRSTTKRITRVWRVTRAARQRQNESSMCYVRYQVLPLVFYRVTCILETRNYSNAQCFRLLSTQSALKSSHYNFGALMASSCPYDFWSHTIN